MQAAGDAPEGPASRPLPMARTGGWEQTARQDLLLAQIMSESKELLFQVCTQVPPSPVSALARFSGEVIKTRPGTFLR